MADPLRKVQAGQSLAIPAAAYNAFVDAAQDFQFRRRSQLQDSQQGFRQTGIVRLKNGSEDDQSRFAILGIDEPILSPEDNLDAFRNEVTLVGIEPDSQKHAGRFAILLEPIGAGRIGLAVVAGVGIVKIDIKEECHAFAEIVDGKTSHLRSGTSGSAIILWKETGTGVKWAVVRIGATDRGFSCDVCPEMEGSCAFEARFIEDSTSETEWVEIESGCGEGYSCQHPVELPTLAQAEANEWSRTCCTPTMRDQGCGASCTWLWDGAAWVLDDNPCPGDCPCESPSEGLVGSTGAKTLTPCGQPPAGGGDCATTTTAPPECENVSCDGECRWMFSYAEKKWIFSDSDCASNCCECVPPRHLGEPCEEAITECREKHGPDRGDCDGECQAFFNFDSGTWVASGCGPGCLCDHPTPPPPEDPLCTSPKIKGRCIPNPCQGGCDWSWDGSGWVLQSSDCAGEGYCGCVPPASAGSASEVARTCCGPPPTTTTTSTTTTANCCDLPDVWETRFIGTGVCSFDELITFTRVGDKDEWFYSGVLSCGDFYSVTARCDRSKLPDCGAFTYDGYFPCAGNFRWVSNDDCQCETPPFVAATAEWFADSVTGCKCCQGGGDPSTTTTQPLP